MSPLQTPLLTDTWVTATWNDYLLAIEDPAFEKAKGYYYWGHMRIEMPPVGFDHGTNHSIIAFAINLFAVVKGIALTMVDNCTYRKEGVQECQPDVSCYVGDKAGVIPNGTNIVDLNQYPAPDLVVEVAKTALLDDLGAKRSLYEDLGVAEYWVVDVQNAQILAFSVGDRGSKRIDESQVLRGLGVALLENALRRSRQTNQSQVGAWLLTQFQQVVNL